VRKPALLPRLRLLQTVVATVVSATALAGQQPAQSPLKLHYDAAYRLQSAGKIPAADAEHAIFLALALHQLAIGYANAGDYPRATALFDEALAEQPNDLPLRKDYAEAAIDAQDAPKAQSLLENAFGPAAAQFSPSVQAAAHRVLGDALLTHNQIDPALANYRAAYELDHSYESLYALGFATLTVKGDTEAAPLFAQLLARFGDKAATHMAIAHAYGQTTLPARAEEEYKKALAKDPSIPGAHFGIGAALLNDSRSNSAAAQAEFHKEILAHPDDAMSWFELGSIAASANDPKEAESDLKRSSILAPGNPDTWMELGKLYMQQQRPQDAEQAFRQAIVVTANPARNRYAIQRAHFSLGKILQAAGEKEEAEKELAISAQMLDLIRNNEEDSMKGNKTVNTNLRKSRGASPAEKAELRQFESSVSPLIAGSYNNLGVHAAMAGNFKNAEDNFRLAAQWQPTLQGVDKNWGRAAFAAHDYEQAVAPLQRSVEEHPEDAELRAILTECKQRSVKAN
jgi:tetratricopeptide (TPR) repeat protein